MACWSLSASSWIDRSDSDVRYWPISAGSTQFGVILTLVLWKPEAIDPKQASLDGCCLYLPDHHSVRPICVRRGQPAIMQKCVVTASGSSIVRRRFS